MSRKDLLALDFEGILKYFRVHMPKKYRTEEAARELMATAVAAKVIEVLVFQLMFTIRWGFVGLLNEKKKCLHFLILASNFLPVVNLCLYKSHTHIPCKIIIHWYHICIKCKIMSCTCIILVWSAMEVVSFILDFMFQTTFLYLRDWCATTTKTPLIPC